MSPVDPPWASRLGTWRRETPGNVVNFHVATLAGAEGTERPDPTGVVGLGARFS